MLVTSDSSEACKCASKSPLRYKWGHDSRSLVSVPASGDSSLQCFTLLCYVVPWVDRNHTIPRLGDKLPRRHFSLIALIGVSRGVICFLFIFRVWTTIVRLDPWQWPRITARYSVRLGWILLELVQLERLKLFLSLLLFLFASGPKQGKVKSSVPAHLCFTESLLLGHFNHRQVRLIVLFDASSQLFHLPPKHEIILTQDNFGQLFKTCCFLLVGGPIRERLLPVEFRQRVLLVETAFWGRRLQIGLLADVSFLLVYLS